MPVIFHARVDRVDDTILVSMFHGLPVDRTANTSYLTWVIIFLKKNTWYAGCFDVLFYIKNSKCKLKSLCKKNQDIL
jgi:hypothetical protein